MRLHRPGRRSAGRSAARVVFALLPVAAAWVPAARAQDAGGTQDTNRARGAFTVTPTASVQEILTDNVFLSRDKQADLTTQASAGLHAVSRGGQVRGFFDYTLSGIVRSSKGAGSQVQNALNTRATAELLPNRFFVDLTGNISQQSISAFGTQSTDNTSANQNRTEVRTFGVSPYLRGQLTPGVSYEARLNGNWSHGGTAAVSNADLYGALLHLGSSSPGLFGWTLDGSHQTVAYSLGSRAQTDSVRGTLNYSPNNELTLSLIAGRESNNYLTTDKVSYNDEGVGLQWKPSTRTSLVTRYEHRYFGNSHQLDFLHRTAWTTWTLLDTRDVVTSPVPTSNISSTPSAAYQQLFASLAARYPDPVERDIQTRILLANQNISPVTQAVGGFQVSQVILQRQQSVSVSLNGTRNTLVLRAGKTVSSGLNNRSIGSLDIPGFTSGALGSNTIRQTIVLADVTHRLTPISNLGTSFSWARTAGDLDAQTSTLRTIYVTYSTQTSPTSSLAGGLRHATYDSLASGYVENAVYATYTLRF